MKSLDPKKLLQALQSGAPVPFPDAEAGLATRLLTQPHPDLTEVESLPAVLAEALLEAAVARGDAALVERLSVSTHKVLAKAAKKAAYRLRSAGLEVQSPATPSAAPAPPAATDELPALLSGVTGSGERALVVVRPLRAGGLDMFQLVISDELGVLHLRRQSTSRSAYRAQVKELRRGQVPTLEVDTARAREELSVALGANLASRTPLPPHTDELARALGARPVETEPDLPLPEEGDATLATEAHTLHNEPEIRGWLPPEEDLRAVSEKLEAMAQSPLALTEAQRGQQMFELFRHSAQAFFTPARSRLYARRLWRMAELFERTGRERQARLARAEARRLFHQAPGYFTRFGEFIFEKVVHLSRILPHQGPAPVTPEPESKSAPTGQLIIP